MNSFSYELIIFNGFAKSIIEGIVSSSIYKAQSFFRDEAIHVVCRVSEKLLQRSRWDFLRRHQYIRLGKTRMICGKATKITIPTIMAIKNGMIPLKIDSRRTPPTAPSATP